MIRDIGLAISDKLKELYPESIIYTESIPESFDTSSFVVTLTKQEYSKRLNNRYESVFFFDVAYFSDKENTEKKEDLQNVQLTFFRSFYLTGGCRVLNKQAAVLDDVLHVTFQVSMFEKQEENCVKMQKQQTNTNY